MSQIRSHTTRSRLWAATAVLIGTCTLTVATQPASAQEKFAVFVGINDYIEFGDEPGGDLQGAESDALFMKAEWNRCHTPVSEGWLRRVLRVRS